MKRLQNQISTLSALVGLAPIYGAFINVIKILKDDTTLFQKIEYSFYITFCLSMIAAITLFYIIINKRLINSKSYKLENYLDKYLKSDGKKWNQTGLVKATKASIKLLNEKGTTNTLDSDIYYMYLFALLSGASSRIWAASIMGENEWIETNEEEEFLKLNLEASNRKVLVERIFIVEQKSVNAMLNNEAIRKQIQKRNDYFKTYIVIEEELASKKPNLITDIGSGFLAFDDFAIASDVFEDSFIRGILTLDNDVIKRNNRIFTNLRDFARPLDNESAKKLLENAN